MPAESPAPNAVLAALGLAGRLEGRTLRVSGPLLLSALAGGVIVSVERRGDGHYAATERQGARALVDVVTGRHVRQLPLADVWHLAHAGEELVDVRIPHPGAWAFALALSAHDGEQWATTAEDASGAAVAVNDPPVYHALLPAPNRTAWAAARSIDADSASGAHRAVASGRALEYLADPAADALNDTERGDTAPAPRSWAVTRNGTMLAGARADGATGGPLGRLARLRGRMAAALTADAWLASKRSANGALGRWSPPGQRDDGELGYGDDHDERLQWVDPVGDEVVGIVQAEIDREDAAAARAAARVAELLTQLPIRQRAVMTQLAAGRSAAEVAADLGITTTTVRVVKSQVKAALNARFPSQ